jgi:tetratricopeptide (TPR) repeat protein
MATGARADSYYLYCMAQQALMRRDFSNALRYLERAAEADPNSAALAVELGQAYLNLDEPDSALRQAARATAIDPSWIEAKRLRAATYRFLVARTSDPSEELFNEAVAAHVDLLNADPSDSEVRIGLGRLYFARGLFLQAAEIFRAQLTAEPDSIEARYFLAQSLLRAGSASEAQSVLEAAIEARPDSMELRRAMVDVLEAQGDLEEAADLLLDLVQAAPESRSYRFTLIRLYEKMKKYAEAASHASLLVRSLHGAPEGSAQQDELRAAHMLLIETMALNGRLDEALEAALTAERELPGEERFPLKRAELLLVLGRDAEAESVLKKAKSAPSGDVSPSGAASGVYLRAGARLDEKGDKAKAEKLLRKAVEADPSNHAALNYLGYFLAERGADLDEALALVKKAVALDEGNGAYLDSLGWALFRLGRFDQAEEPLTMATKLIPEEAVVFEHLGDLYWAMGRSDDAVKAWKEAVRIGGADTASIQAKIGRAAQKQKPNS